MSPYKITGKKRKKIKKEISQLKTEIKNFWYFHQIDKDFAFCYGSTDNYPISDDEAKMIYEDLVDRQKYLEKKLLQTKEN